MKIFDKWLLHVLLVVDFYFSESFNWEHSDMYELPNKCAVHLNVICFGEGDDLHWECDSTSVFSKSPFLLKVTQISQYIL